MWERHVFRRLGLIGAVLVVALILLIRYDRNEGFTVNLRPGLDIAGGVSMIFEIEEQPGENNPRLAEEMKRLLQRRVDPKGVYDLKWRVLGSNRLEVQMPLPPRENTELREAYRRAEDALFQSNIGRGELERALRRPPDQRGQELIDLAGGNQKRLDLLRAAAQKWDAYQQVMEQTAEAPGTQPTGTQPATDETQRQILRRDATEALQDAIDRVIETNLNPQEFITVRDQEPDSEMQKKSVEQLQERYPARKEEIAAAMKAYNTWRGKRTFLEGPADLRRLLRGAGVLEFRILAEPTQENVAKYDRLRKQLEERGPLPIPGQTERWFKVENPLAFFNVDTPRELETADPRTFEARGMVVGKRGNDWYVLAYDDPDNAMLVERGAGGPRWKLTRAYLTRDQHGRQAVGFDFDAVGANRFARLTGNHIEDLLGVFIDDLAYSAATIQSKISRSGIITGDFSREKLLYLVQTMQAGVLPARLKDTPLSERTIGSSLGATNLHRAFQAGVAGLVAVGVLMIAYYWWAGLIANAALVMNVVLVLAAMAMLGARITLAGIAGIILTIGMSVDANVLIFERMREEKQRGSSLRMIIKNGYDKALSTILDANVTTLLTCIIIYKVGSEEIKGFGLTLGWGIVTSLFTALFVTRTLFTLLVKYKVIQDIRMLKLIGVPKIDWYGKRRIFYACSAVLILGGLSLLYLRGTRDTLDVEFLGGVSAEVEVKQNASREYDDRLITGLLEDIGDQITREGQRLAEATVQPIPGDPTGFEVTAPGVPARHLAAMIGEPLESGESGDLLARDGVEALTGDSSVRVRVKSADITAGALQEAVRRLADRSGDSIPLTGENIRRANVGMVIDSDSPEDRGRFWDITTTATNKSLVQTALVSAFGDDLQIQPRISYVPHLDREGRPFPITDRRIDATVVPDLPTDFSVDAPDYVGGAAIYFSQLDPPQPLETLHERLRNMRLQPDYADLPWRPFDVFGVTQAGTNADGQRQYSGVLIAVVDGRIRYEDDADQWATLVAEPELALARDTLDTEQSLRAVTQFKPAIASQSQTRASLALLLSWAMIIGYLWIRFGRPMFGLAGVAALIHDVCVALAFVGISGWIGGAHHPIGRALLIGDFKIDMTIVAAFLTIIGYSVNDTIIVFDRIRENRGRLGVVTPEIINNSINQTLSRTLLTSGTTFLVLLTMYIFGGSSIRGFNYCMIVGILTGTYSSIAVASPMLMLRARERRGVPRARLAPA